MNIIEKESITGDLIDDIILRSVEDIKYHKHPDDRYQAQMSVIGNIFKESCDRLNKHLGSGSKIVVLMDQDNDGVTSTVLLYRFLRDDLGYNNIDVIIPEGKTHGLTPSVMEKVYDLDTNLLIIPDAASNDTEQLEELNNNNIETIVLDHHEINVKQVHNSVVNNQQHSEIESEYTGVGMTYLFCKCYSYHYDVNVDLDKYLDLVALGQTADVSDISVPEIRYIVYTGVRNINNSFIKATMKRKDIDNPSTRDWSFSIISMINAVTRIGTVSEKRRMFDALMSDSSETETVEIRKKNKKTGKFDKIPTEMTFQEIVVKECEKLKTKQDKIVKDALQDINIIYDNKVLIAVSEGDYPSSINGLTAMKLCDKHRKPAMVGKWFTDGHNVTHLSGSIRAQNVDFKNILSKSKLFNLLQGHSQACGFSIKEDDLNSLYEYLDGYKFKTNSDYYVDILTDKPNESDIIQVELNKDIFGGQVEMPLFGYEEIEFNKRCINKRGSVLSFFDDNVTFVLFNAPDGIKEEIDNYIVNNNITMNIVGEPRISKFGNKEQSQIVIKDYEFLEVEKDDEPGIWGIDF